MKVLIRKELDTEKPINLHRLSSFMKLYAGIITKWRDTKLYKINLNKRLEAEHQEQVQKDEKLKEILLAQIYSELTNNLSLAKRGEVCDSIIISVKSSYFSSLDRILGSKDFLLYDIKRVEEVSDLRIAFSDMPILLEVRKKAI